MGKPGDDSCVISRHQSTYTSFIGASEFKVSPGVTYQCFGPFKLPDKPGMIVGFQPEASMDIVHHMLLFGRASGPSSCHSDVLYSWARTGQDRPQGLNFSDSPVSGLGFEVGLCSNKQAEYRYRYLSLQIHYQRSADVDNSRYDSSGIRLTIASTPPQRTPLRVEVLALIPYIPARSISNLCIRCTVQSAGVVYAYRNHAHRLGRDIWSDHLRSGKPDESHPPLGLMSAQKPQIVRILDPPIIVEQGDVLQLHCIYNATLRDEPTTLNRDEAQGEMCNQYLFASAELSVACGLNGGCQTPISPTREISTWHSI